MKMLKKLALVLLMSGPCGMQAMEGLEVGRLDFDHPNHYRAHADLYTDDGANPSSIELVDSRENIIRAEQAKEVAERAKAAERAAEDARLSAIARSRGVNPKNEASYIAGLREDLTARRGVQDAQSREFGRETTFGDVLAQEEQRVENERGAREAAAARELARPTFERIQRTPQQVAAERAREGLATRRRDFERMHFEQYPEQYEPGDGFYNPEYHLKPEYRQAFDAELASIR